MKKKKKVILNKNIKPKKLHKKLHKNKVNKVNIKKPKKNLKAKKIITSIDIPVFNISSNIKHPSEIKPRKKRSKNGTSVMYFTQNTEDAINKYNTETDLEVREKIFTDHILQPFQKLVENVFNTFKFSYFETGPLDVQKECLSHLVSNLHKFDPNRKSKIHPDKKAKAFAYFSIIAKHYLILLNNTNYKKFNQNVEINEDRDENTVQLQQIDGYYAKEELNDFVRLMIGFWESNISKIFTKNRDLNIANAVIELFRNSNRIDAYNKKSLYLYIREMANVKTQQITKILNKMKTYNTQMTRNYINSGQIGYENKV